MAFVVFRDWKSFDQAKQKGKWASSTGDTIESVHREMWKVSFITKTKELPMLNYLCKTRNVLISREY